MRLSGRYKVDIRSTVLARHRYLSSIVSSWFAPRMTLVFDEKSGAMIRNTCSSLLQKDKRSKQNLEIDPQLSRPLASSDQGKEVENAAVRDKWSGRTSVGIQAEDVHTIHDAAQFKSVDTQTEALQVVQSTPNKAIEVAVQSEFCVASAGCQTTNGFVSTATQTAALDCNKAVQTVETTETTFYSDKASQFGEGNARGDLGVVTSLARRAADVTRERNNLERKVGNLMDLLRDREHRLKDKDMLENKLYESQSANTKLKMQLSSLQEVVSDMTKSIADIARQVPYQRATSVCTL
mmetsp:Transcript_49285/g.127100  ORF Transcript_49285/g.127100 Transcript_49285/m.127100 type:complete len:294 (-) Transcript_49285:240-1121(-)